MATVPLDQPSSRILTLDVIRGVAVMGIFSVNVVGFAMVEAAYFHPPTYGWNGLADRLMWFANFVLIDGKMRSLFSMLFGASMLLVAERAEAAGESPVAVHYRRMFVLLLFGLAHFYFLWFGDILTTYAVVGMVAFLFWRLNAVSLAAFAATAYIFAFAFSLSDAAGMSHAVSILASGQGGDAELEAARGTVSFLAPDRSYVGHDLAVHQSFAAYVRETTGPRAREPLDTILAIWPETLALMLLGMAGYRSGFLTGAWPRGTYRRVAIFGIGLGAIFSGVFAAIVWANGFRLPLPMLALETWSMPAHPVMALAYAALIILLIRERGALTQRFAAVGRAAFTNYLGTSILATFVFNGWGLDLYGGLSRAECWLFVPLFWLLMLLWSKPWLDRFRYGPFEWLWRSLARGKLQPMRKAVPAA
jgi:uncharacterized protein